MDMKGAVAEMQRLRKERVEKHREVQFAIHGSGMFITEFTAKELRKVKVDQKTTFAKGKSAAYNGIWRHNSVPLPK